MNQKLTIAFLIVTATLAPAKDWPEFCGSHCKNMVADESNLPDTFVPGEKDSMKGEIILSTATNVKWGVRIGSITYSSPTIVGGKIFIGSGEKGQGIFKCLDIHTGKTLWQYAEPFRQFPKEIEPGMKYMLGRITPNLGICATAAADGEGVYFVNHRCEVLCLNANTGAEVWRFDMWNYGIRPSDACDGSPLLDGDLLYVNPSNGVDRDAQIAYYDDRKPPAPNAPNLLVFEKKTGRLVATDDAREIGPKLMHGEWSTPSLGLVNGRKLIFYGAGNGKCYAFEALNSVPDKPVKLKTVWSFDCNPPEYKHTGEFNWAAYYSLGDKRLKRSLNKQNESSFVGMSEIIACPVFYKNRVYIAIGRDPEHGKGRGALWCIDATKTGDITKTGKIWGYQGLDRTLSTVSISDGLLYIADVAGRLHCLDADTGKVEWVHETNASLWSSTLVADGKIYLPSTKCLWVFAAGKEKKVLSQINVGAPIYAMPVAVEETLYITSRNYLWAVQQQ